MNEPVLSADQIETVRRKYLGDVWDPHPEWGKPGAAHVSAAGLVGDQTVAVAGLGAGSVRRGTRLRFGGRQDQYQVTTATSITSGAATVSIAPLLAQPVASGDVVTVEPYAANVFNRRYGREFLSDINLQDIAVQAWKEFSRKLVTATNPDEAILRAVALLGFRRMALPGSEFEDAARAADPVGQGRVTLEAIARSIKELEGYVAVNTVGPIFLNTCK